MHESNSCQSPSEATGPTATATKSRPTIQWVLGWFVLGAAIPVGLGLYGMHQQSVSLASLEPETASSIVDYDAAVETLATAHDLTAVNKALRTLDVGGRAAVDALRKHLSDERVLPSGFSSRVFTANSETKMSDESFWLIQDLIETPFPKVYGANYHALDRESIERWLDQYENASITGLRIEAATLSLDIAKRDLEMTGSQNAREAVEICREHLTQLRSTRQED